MKQFRLFLFFKPIEFCFIIYSKNFLIIFKNNLGNYPEVFYILVELSLLKKLSK